VFTGKWLKKIWFIKPSLGPTISQATATAVHPLQAHLAATASHAGPFSTICRRWHYMRSPPLHGSQPRRAQQANPRRLSMAPTHALPHTSFCAGMPSPMSVLHLPPGHAAATSIGRCHDVTMSPAWARGFRQTHRLVARYPRSSCMSQPLEGHLALSRPLPLASHGGIDSEPCANSPTTRPTGHVQASASARIYRLHTPCPKSPVIDH
jgi:hypothetical protein